MSDYRSSHPELWKFLWGDGYNLTVKAVLAEARRRFPDIPLVDIVQASAAADPDGKRADVPFTDMTVNGVTINSRYRKRHEFVTMRQVVELLPDHVCRDLISLSCDSKAGASYEAVIRSSDREAMGMALHYAIIDVSDGHNGIWVEHLRGEPTYCVEPWWRGDPGCD